jgi:hypothetical protein
MTEFPFGFTDNSPFGWSFSTDDYDNHFAFDPGPNEFPLSDRDSFMPSHRRTQSARCFGYSNSLSDGSPKLSNPLPKRPESDQPSGRSDDDLEFANLCEDVLITLKPSDLGFIPVSHWTDGEMTFGGLVSNHFQQKSGRNTRFFHKLYNALKISEYDRFYSEYVGVEWITDQVIKIDKKKFARLLGIHAIEGSLFHQQGNFPSHGFRELGPSEAKEMVPSEELASVDYDNIRLLVHAPGDFVRGSAPQVIDKCRWINSRQK